MNLLKISRDSIISIVILAVSLFAGLTIVAFAQEAPSNDGGKGITFPIPELGSCNSKEECKSYCDDVSHANECVSFATAHGLMSKEDGERTLKVANIEGPGGCRGRECERYCEDTAHIEECVSFAEKNNILPKERVDESRKVLQALKSGAKLPGGCKTKQECESYCEDINNSEECFSFAEKAGFIPKEEIEKAKKFNRLMKDGEMPGGCQSKKGCEEYCSAEVHFNECIDFFEKHEVVDKKEIEVFRKTGGKGPGGCVGRECQTFCDNPANHEACFEFARENNLIPEEELARIKEGTERMKEAFSQASPELLACFKERLGEDVLSKMEKGEFTPGPRVGDAMKGCFDREARKRDSENRNFDYNRNIPDERMQQPKEVSDCIRKAEEELHANSSDSFSPEEMRGRVEKCFSDNGIDRGNMMRPQGENENFDENRGEGFFPHREDGFGKDMMDRDFPPNGEKRDRMIFEEGNQRGIPPQNRPCFTPQRGDVGDNEEKVETGRDMPCGQPNHLDGNSKDFPNMFEGGEHEQGFRKEGEFIPRDNFQGEARQGEGFAPRPVQEGRMPMNEGFMSPNQNPMFRDGQSGFNPMPPKEGMMDGDHMFPPRDQGINEGQFQQGFNPPPFREGGEMMDGGAFKPEPQQIPPAGAPLPPPPPVDGEVSATNSGQETVLKMIGNASTAFGLLLRVVK